MSQFAGDEFDLYALMLQAMQQGLELQRLEDERKLGWGAESARVQQLMDVRALRLASAKAAAVPQPLGVAEPVFS